MAQAPRPLLFDTHTHLNSPSFDGDLPATLARARDAGVGSAVVVGYDLESSRRAVALAEAHDRLFAAVGIHPHSADQTSPETLRELKDLAGRVRVVAIGETGLDFHRNLAPRQAQLRSFAWHLELAEEVGLPVIVHIRNAFEEATDALSGYRGTGVVHCYTGTPEQLPPLLEKGLYVSFSAVITYRTGSLVRRALAEAPADRVLVETDCPYLPPDSRRGRRNEPAFLIETAQMAAEMRGLPFEELARLTTANASNLFGIERGR